MRKISLFLFFSLLITCFASPSLALLMDELDKMTPQEAYEFNEKLSKKAMLGMPARGHGGGWSVSYYIPNLQELNSGLPGGLPKIPPMTMWGGTYRYTLAPEFQIGFYGGGGSAGSYRKSSGNVGRATLGIGVFEILAAAKPIRAPHIEYVLEGGIGYYFANYSEEITLSGAPTTWHVWTGDTIGLRIGAGMKYRVNPLLSIGTYMNYIIAKINALREAGQIDSNKPPIDLSGLSFKLGMEFHF